MTKKLAVVETVDLTHTIKSADEHRRLMLDAMVALVEGRMNIGQANALSSLSAEVHKSLKLEFDMVSYAAENLMIGEGNQVMLLEREKDDC